MWLEDASRFTSFCDRRIARRLLEEGRMRAAAVAALPTDL
jgi:hypothetical protein